MHEPAHEQQQAEEPARPALAPAAREGGVVGTVLGLQRAAGNRATTALLQRKGKPKPPPDPFDTLVKAKKWTEAADALSELPDTEIEARIKKLRRAQREALMQGVRAIERISWMDPVIDAMEKIDPKSANIGSLRWARSSGFTTRADLWFKGLSMDDARKTAKELGFSRAQLLQIIGQDNFLMETFRDPWAYVPKDERMLYVMTLLVDTYGYPVSGAAGLVGNLAGESGLIPSRIEGSAEVTPMRSANFNDHTTDWTETEISERDKATKKGPKLPGVGLAQWTAKTRREGLFARPQGVDILFDMDAQVSYLVDELAASFANVDTKLRNSTTTVQQAADLVLEKFEAPKDPEASRSTRRNNAARAARLYNDAQALKQSVQAVTAP